MAEQKRLKVYFDGGCRPNPGPIEVAAVLRGTAHLRTDLGIGSNGDAEWLALIHALEVAQASGAVAYDLIGDSRSVVDQANGRAKAASPTDQAHLARFWGLAEANPPARIRWIKREQNLAGIALNAGHPR